MSKKSFGLLVCKPSPTELLGFLRSALGLPQFYIFSYTWGLAVFIETNGSGPLIWLLPSQFRCLDEVQRSKWICVKSCSLGWLVRHEPQSGILDCPEGAHQTSHAVFQRSGKMSHMWFVQPILKYKDVARIRCPSSAFSPVVSLHHHWEDVFFLYLG